ncbi:DUF1566 domain-containing protein [Sulfurovum lithotrophicum]|uniref:Lcl C-terminal domain-containing protein n=1 Tax=Sulfurovum lithotrophicum TaxID=206403 RepID=UPI0006984123|nr:DUF1566 domain-containing protein [Sulfurovum lithotrophicum]
MKTALLLIVTGTLLFGASSKLDEKTGLIWQDNKSVATVEKSYVEASNYCKQLSVDGFEDWRLPSIKELYTIVDLRRERPALKNGFSMRVDEWFWTATPFVGDPKKEAWKISMRYGEAEPTRQDRMLHIRCVRSVRKPQRSQKE